MKDKEAREQIEMLKVAFLEIAKVVGTQQKIVEATVTRLNVQHEGLYMISADVKEMCTHVSNWVESQGGQGWK